MRVLRVVILVLLVLLCGAFSIQFYLFQNELINQPEPSPYFSADAAPQYAVGGYHFLAFFVLGAVILARKYYWAFGLAVTYFLLNIFATYARLGTGFFGGDMCPDGHPCLLAIRRASWFDWTAAVLLLGSLVLISVALYSSGRGREAT